MKRILMLCLSLCAVAVFAAVGPTPTTTADGKIIMPFADIRITAITNFRISYETNGVNKFVWLHFRAKISPVEERILLKDFVGEAVLRDPQSGVKETYMDASGNPVVSVKYSEFKLGSYGVAPGQSLELQPSETSKEFVISLGQIAGPDDKINDATRQKLIKVFNIFANGRSKDGYELRLIGKASPGVLGKNGAWVFLKDSVSYVWIFDMTGTGISYPLKPAEAK